MAINLYKLTTKKGDRASDVKAGHAAAAEHACSGNNAATYPTACGAADGARVAMAGPGWNSSSKAQTGPQRSDGLSESALEIGDETGPQKAPMLNWQSSRAVIDERQR